MSFDHRIDLGAIVAVLSLVMMGCTRSENDSFELTRVPPGWSMNVTANDGLSPTSRKSLAGGPAEADFPALHNLIRVSDTIYCGGEPKGDEAFESLVRLGVTTLVSVDGARPDVEMARKWGLRYVHIPIGYEGIDALASGSLARLVRDCDEPFYIHCHHGRHRGPAAAAVAWIASGDADGSAAIRILTRAGTSKGYTGLWRDVESFQAPGPEAVLPDLVEVADVGSFAAAMAQIDRAYDNLKLCRDAGWSTPKDHPDLVPAHEALLLKEGLRESGRNLANPYGVEFETRLTESESIAQSLEGLLASNAAADHVSNQFNRLELSCARCHDKFRN